jgi:molybdopterin synthase catalytic subunit
MQPDIRVQPDPFDYGAECASLMTGARDTGAVVSFCGIVRDDGGDLQEMQIEHYPGMTERALTGIAQDAIARWNLTACKVIHRYGPLTPGTPIMMVATAARHRAQAFEAADFLMDYLKSRAPFWKKEITSTGADWVAAKGSDEAALKRW